MTSATPATLLETCIQAALEAGRAVLHVYHTDFAVETKSDDSPLTAADRSSHRIVADALAATGIPVVSEESPLPTPETRRGWPRLWMVDPLDGTREFVGRNGDFTVNIALIENGRPVLGVVYAPAAQLLYYGAAGHPSCRVKPAVCTPRVPEATDLMDRAQSLPLADGKGNCLTAAGSRSHMDPDTTAYLDEVRRVYGPLQLLSRGSSLKFGLVAEGTALIYPRLAPTMEWDTAAGHAVVRFAGGTVRTPEGRELTYNKDDLHNPSFVVRGAGFPPAGRDPASAER